MSVKLTKAFTCVLPGEIYPVELAAGEECPEEYENSARAQGCLGKAEPQPKPEQTKAPQPKPEKPEGAPEKASDKPQAEGGEQKA